jgi:hypothetical protein
LLNNKEKRRLINSKKRIKSLFLLDVEVVEVEVVDVLVANK